MTLVNLNSVLVLSLAYPALMLVALVAGCSSPHLRRYVICQRLIHIRKIYRNGTGVAVSCLYALFALVSLPAGILHKLWVGNRRKQAMRNRIDFWVFIWFSIALLLLLLGGAGTWWILAIVPVIRITDITYTLLLVLVLPGQSTSPSFARPLILLITHLLEITISFAIFYQVACAAGELKVDGVVCPCMSSLEGRDALYFSLVTAATVGYGDIVPLSSARWITVSQIILSLFLTLISIPRVFNNYPPRAFGASSKAK